MVKVFEVSILVLAGILAVSAQCPTIIPRGGWSTREARFVPVLPIRPTPLVIAHPTGTAGCATQAECAEVIRNIQDFQIDGNGWSEISYHFLIDEAGRIFQGRGWGRMGQNVENFSNQAINVGFIGAHTLHRPTTEAQASFESLIACGISERALDLHVNVVAQCQVTRMVSCEATTIFPWISEHDRFIANPTPV